MADALDFRIVDPHIHQWDPKTTPRGTTVLAKLLDRWPELYLKVGNALIPRPIHDFVGDPATVLLPYMPLDIARDAASSGVDTVVHVEAGWTGSGVLGAVGETRWLDALGFEAAGLKLGAIVAHADLRSAKIDALLAAHVAASPKMRGIRHMASHHPSRAVFDWSKRPHLYTEAEFLHGFERLVARDLSFDAWVYSAQLPDVTALAKRFPEARIVLDHVGTPVGVGGPVSDVGATADERARILGAWREDLARLAEHKNVSAKISGLAMPVLGFGFHTRAQDQVPTVDELFERFAPLVRHALDVFGVPRCFFASNFPMDKVSAPYERILAAYVRLAAERGSQAPRALLRDNALRFYRVG